jgi:hypothetical protein
MTESGKPPTVFVAAGANTYNIFSGQEHRPFTLAGSTGTIDEDSTSIFQVKNFTVLLRDGQIGQVNVRYNILAVDGTTAFCPGTNSVVKTRFRNSDNLGNVAKVTYDIHRTNVNTGGNTIIYSFSSNGRSLGSSFTTATDLPAIGFDFANNVYWIEAAIFRSDPAQFADLGSIQIYELAGTACP